MTPLRRLHVGALVLALAAGCGALGLRALDAADPVSVDEAVTKFRERQSRSPAPGAPGTPSATPTPTAARGTATTPGSKPATGATASARPGAPATSAPAAGERAIPPTPEGVYVYATTGYETGKSGPMSARHDYPERTTMTTRRDGCGSSHRWEPVEDRWDDVTDCVVGNTTKIRVYDTFHSFFGVSERHTYRCSGDSWFRPPSTRVGYRWSFDCVAEKARTHTDARIVGIERVSAGDGMVDALHVRFETSMSGATTGTNPTDYWIALDEPVLVRKTGRVDATVRSDLGTLTYHEEYDIRLTSREPRT